MRTGIKNLHEDPHSPSTGLRTPGRTTVEDMGVDHGRLYVAMAQKLLDRADIVASTSGWGAGKWQLRVIGGLREASPNPNRNTLYEDTP